jgi:hypothetical protein
MRGTHLDPLLVGGIHPAAKNAPAREHQRMRAIAVDDRQLEITVEGRSRDWLPHAAIDARIRAGVFDLDQFASAELVAAAARGIMPGRQMSISANVWRAIMSSSSVGTT